MLFRYNVPFLDYFLLIIGNYFVIVWAWNVRVPPVSKSFLSFLHKNPEKMCKNETIFVFAHRQQKNKKCAKSNCFLLLSFSHRIPYASPSLGYGLEWAWMGDRALDRGRLSRNQLTTVVLSI
jgi:hypothetical protein